MKTTIIALLVALVAIAFASPVFAEDLASAKDGIWSYQDSLVRSIPNFSDAIPVLVACGENERVAGGFPGNAWLQDSGLKKGWKNYALTPPTTVGGLWTFKVPASLKVVDKVRHNLAQVNNGVTNWLQIHEFRSELPYTAAQDSDGKWHNGIVLPTK